MSSPSNSMKTKPGLKRNLHAEHFQETMWSTRKLRQVSRFNKQRLKCFELHSYLPVKLREKRQQTSSANPEVDQYENHAAEYLHLAYTALNDIFKEYLSVTMSNTAPNVDADTWNRINRSDSFKNCLLC